MRPDFDPAALERLLGGPISLTPVEAGQSNPTWFVSASGRELVLRKKPAGTTLDSAHAVDREYRVMRALAGSDVPVPRMVMLQTDPAVLGTAFYLMERVPGRVSADSALPDVAPRDRRAFYGQAARIMAALHRVDWAARGLSDFGRPGDYYARQVARWARQWQASRTRDDPRIDRLAAWFADHIPAPQPTAIVHGDFRIGNLIHALDGPPIRAVLDWELSTLGDPLADLTHSLMFWHLEPAQLGGVAGVDLAAAGLPTERDFVAAYRAAGGCAAPVTPFHRAFAFYRMAIIFEGIAARVALGQSVHPDAGRIGGLAPICAAHAERLIKAGETL